MSRVRVVLLTVLALAACDRAAAPAEPETPASPSARLTEVRLDKTGLTPANPDGGTGRRLVFGEGEETVVAFLSVLHGGARPERTSNAECPAGPMIFADWGDGLVLSFQDDRFAGWIADETAAPGVAAEGGVRVGSTLAQVRAAWPGVETRADSLGPEFTANGLSGTLSGPAESATVTRLWAGATCIFR